MPLRVSRRALPALLLISLYSAAPARAALPRVPDGFEVRLVASVPAVEYPCQVATAPDGALYVAEDPMDQVGPYEASDGRILVFREGRDPVVFADGFRAIFGMAWHDGRLYVSHMPFLTVLTDTDGDDKADRREDLFKDLGPTANKGLNDHIVSGLQFGMDGYLYIAVGDKGIPRATGPDGRTIQIVGGGTCRCRPDGTGLEVVSTGTRNHLEPNLDAADNLFTYDNTDDGDGWWTRVTHHVDGGYYGYPYDYHPRPERHLPRMAEYGGGSPCGAVFYKEDAWPESYRGVGFWAEWGKGKVHAFRFAPDGSTFKVAEAIDFAVPDRSAGDFRPIDLAVSYDGRTLYVADWNMGGWGNKQEKVGRVFAITYKGEVARRPRGHDADPVEVQIRQLDHPSFNERMRAQAALIRKGFDASYRPVEAALHDVGTAPLARRHLVWALVELGRGRIDLVPPLAQLLSAEDPEVRAQAARALGMVGDTKAAGALTESLKDNEPAVRLQAVIALGRIQARSAVPALLPILAETDAYLAFSARQALRRIGDWTGATAGLRAEDAGVRLGVLAAMEQVYQLDAATALANYARDGDRPPGERAKALAYLAEGHRKARPWDGRWWGTRPTRGKPPARVEEWEGTPIVLEAVRRGLVDPLSEVRLAAVSAVVVTGDREAKATLRGRFATDDDSAVRRRIAEALGTLEDREAVPALIAAVRDPDAPASVRDAALEAVEDIGGAPAIAALVDLLERKALAAERQPRVIAALGKFRARAAVGVLVEALRSPEAGLRIAAAEALGEIGEARDAAGPLRELLDDPSVPVREAAITALGALKDRESIPALLKATEVEDTRYEAGMALAAMPDRLAVRAYLRNLADKSPDLRKASAEALGKVRDQAEPLLVLLAERRELPTSIVPELRKVFTVPRPILGWRVAGPFAAGDKPPVQPGKPVDFARSLVGIGGRPVAWTTVRAADDRGRVDLSTLYPASESASAFAYTELSAGEARDAQIILGQGDLRMLWLNGRKVYDPGDRRVPRARDGRVDVRLSLGTNRLLVQSARKGGSWEFAVAVTEPGDYAFLKAPAAGAFDPEAYRAHALKAKGDPQRGRALFLDLKGLACIKCHAVGDQGGKVGPEMSTIGSKYPRDELIASVLYPSQRISSGYEPVVVAAADGRVITGIVKSDTPEALELEDADAKVVRIPRSEIDEQRKSDVSLMPNGLIEGIGPEGFADLIAFLESLKEVPSRPATGATAR